MKTLIVAGLLASSFLCGCVAPKGAAVKSPAVSFVPAGGGEKRKESVSYDFGSIREGDIQEHAFLIQNEGKKKLTITGTVASCGCASASVRKNTLAPGEETFLDVKFDSKGYSGAITQFVYVNTDDVDNPALKFIIKAVVVPR
ncbi:MAG: DUF1573 domain-containing protein [Candidatus Omnitrophota bacterium]|jgi:hypothetical protein